MFHAATLCDQAALDAPESLARLHSEPLRTQKMNAPLLKILYIDDDENDLALFRIAADEAKLDLWLSTALDIKQAIAHLNGEGECANRLLFPAPDLMLLDLGLPNTSGLDFLHWCRECAISTPPVIVLSSSLRPADKERALALGAADYLEKPLGLDRLKRTVVRIWAFGMNWKRRLERVVPVS